MDSELLALIDQLEALCSTGNRVPLSSRVMISAPETFRLLDQMRQALPREVVRARHIYQERDRILQEAQAEAEAMRAAARAERAALLAEHSITVEAIGNAETITREARAERERLRRETDDYALQSLRDLSNRLTQTAEALEVTQRTVAGGIDLLESRAHASTLGAYTLPDVAEDHNSLKQRSPHLDVWERL